MAILESIQTVQCKQKNNEEDGESSYQSGRKTKWEGTEINQMQKNYHSGMKCSGFPKLGHDNMVFLYRMTCFLPRYFLSYLVCQRYPEAYFITC